MHEAPASRSKIHQLATTRHRAATAVRFQRAGPQQKRAPDTGSWRAAAATYAHVPTPCKVARAGAADGWTPLRPSLLPPASLLRPLLVVHGQKEPRAHETPQRSETRADPTYATGARRPDRQPAPTRRPVDRPHALAAAATAGRLLLRCSLARRGRGSAVAGMRACTATAGRVRHLHG
jgi:hypothetical protein